MSIKKVAVFGLGQDGSYMLEHLLSNTGNTIIVAARRSSKIVLAYLTETLANPRVKSVVIDIADSHSVSQFVESEKPDYLINLAASTFVPDSWENPAATINLNTVALIHILEAVRRFAPNCRVFSAGSSEQGLGMPPTSLYGVSKQAAGSICEVYRKKYGVYVVQGVLFPHSSPRQADCFLLPKLAKGVVRIAKAIKKGKAFEPIEVGNLDARRDYLFAGDVCDGVWRMLNQERYNRELDTLHRHWLINQEGLIGECSVDDDVYGSKVWSAKIKDYVLASGQTHSVREIIDKMFRAAGIKGRWEPSETIYVAETFTVDRFKWRTEVLVRVNPLFLRSDTTQPIGDSTSARQELGWEPKVSLDSLVKLMVGHELKAAGL